MFWDPHTEGKEIKKSLVLLALRVCMQYLILKITSSEILK